MNRSALIGLVVLIAGAVIATVWWLRSNSSPETHPVSNAPPASHAPRPRLPKTPALRPSQPDVAPVPSVANQPPDIEVPNTPAEYVNRKGTLVRDHRGRSGTEEFESVITERPGKKNVEPRVVDDIRSAVYASVRDCMTDMDLDALGDKPKAQTEVLFRIVDGRVAADQAVVKMSGVDKELGTQLATCIQQRAEQLELPADGHEKISQSRVTLLFPLR